MWSDGFFLAAYSTTSIVSRAHSLACVRARLFQSRKIWKKAFTFFQLFFNWIWKETRKVAFFPSLMLFLLFHLFSLLMSQHCRYTCSLFMSVFAAFKVCTDWSSEWSSHAARRMFHSCVWWCVPEHLVIIRWRTLRHSIWCWSEHLQPINHLNQNSSLHHLNCDVMNHVHHSTPERIV